MIEKIPVRTGKIGLNAGCPAGTVSLLALMVNFVAAGADLLIALKVFREGPCLIVDHPTQAGYIAYYR